MEQTVRNEEIIKYYESCDEHYSMLWHLDTHMAMHYGYWDHTTHNLKEALFRLNEKLAETAGIQSNDTVLDAGCGVGGSSLYLARTRGCKVQGITLSQKHADFANQKAITSGLEKLATFNVRDFTRTEFPDNSFDVVWAIESVCHANQKRDFLQEAFRVLKPGGRLIMADFFRTMAEPNAREKYWLDNWARTWAVPHYEFKDQFLDDAKQVGFKEVSAVNASRQIRRSANRLYLYFYPGLIWNYLLKLLGKHKDEHIENIWSAYYQFHSLNRNYWSYEIIHAVKPK